MRRRRSRYTWFPINPTFFGEDTTAYSWYNGQTDVPPQRPGSGNLVAVPLLQDADIDADTTADPTVSLRDRVEGKDYAVERIVGKVWAALTQFPANEPGEFVAQQVLVGMGLAVLPVDDAGANPALPIADYDPLLATNSVSPWMWRRTWVLYNNLASGQPGFTGPTNIGSYGSMADGGHLDAKSVRRVTREQRLYWVLNQYVIEAYAEGGSAQVPILSQLSWGYDLRVLGAMRKARNRSTFK